MYRGDISESYRKTLASSASAKLTLSQKFPVTDKLVSDVLGKPVTVTLNDGTIKTTDTLTNKEKWAIMLRMQSELKDQYHVVACKDYTEAILEIELIVVAEKLEIPELKEIAMNKVSGWFENELKAGLPLSNDLRASAIHVLREHADLANAFIGPCARYLAVVEKDDELTTLIKKMQPITWNAMMSIQGYWATQTKQQQEELTKTTEELTKTTEELTKTTVTLNKTTEALEKTTKVLQALEARTSQNKLISNDAEKVLKSQVETLSRSLAVAEGKTKAAQTTIGQLEDLNRALEQGVMRNAKWRLRENNPPKSDPPNHKSVKEADELRTENSRLRSETEKMKDAFNRFIGSINQEEDCPKCRRRWNVRIGHKLHTSISVACKCCDYKGWHEGRSK